MRLPVLVIFPEIYGGCKRNKNAASDKRLAMNIVR